MIRSADHYLFRNERKHINGGLIMSLTALVATRKGLFTFTSTDDHAHWVMTSSAFLGVSVSMVLVDPRDNKWYAALNHGHFGVKLHRSDNQGQSWQEITTPSYPPINCSDKSNDQGIAENPDNSPGNTNNAEADSIDLIWALETAGDDKPGTLWAGTIPGGLFYSDDCGENWQLNTSLWEREERRQWFGGGYDKPGIHSICVDPRDSDHITLGVSCGGVWSSDDGGTSWANKSKGMRAAFMPPEKQFDPNIQDPHRVVNCNTSPDVFWAQHHNGIFHSRDNAETWQEIENVAPSSFGFAVAVHPNEPDVAWFVPGVKDECRIPVEAKFVVTRTRDGGNRYETLTAGLPSEDAYDLVYRHGLDVDTSGTCLLMGSTTGNLWVSANQGDQWHCISHYLPPVYCVKFIK